MSRWGSDRLRRSHSAEVLAKVQELRSSRPGNRLVRPAGLALLGLAAVAAFDPDYPLPRSVLAQATSTRPATELFPRAIQPQGLTFGLPRRFAWQWHGDPVEWTLVVCDGEWRELWRQPCGRGQEIAPDDGLRALLEQHDYLFWRVEGDLSGRPVQSPPATLVFRRDNGPMASPGSPPRRP